LEQEIETSGSGETLSTTIQEFNPVDDRLKQANGVNQFIRFANRSPFFLRGGGDGNRIRCQECRTVAS
jgi:hypothetical protein